MISRSTLLSIAEQVREFGLRANREVFCEELVMYLLRNHPDAKCEWVARNEHREIYKTTFKEDSAETP